MLITASELKKNLSKYLLMSEKEDIYITKYGNIIAKLTSPHKDRLAIVDSLSGIVPGSITHDELKSERLYRKIFLVSSSD